MKRLLIVSASTGTGHLRAAQALAEAARAADGVHAEHVDLLQAAPGWVRAVYGTGYEWLVERVPRAWHGIYRATDGRRADPARWAPVALRVLFREFRGMLRGGRWDACVCTHFLPCQLAAGGAGLPPFALVMTDFTVHRVWAQRGAARIFAPVESAAAELRRRMPAARVQASGIPVAGAMQAAPSREAARERLGLDGRRMLLVTGGGMGIGVEEAAAAALGALPPDVRVVAVCGRNTEARRRLEALGASAARLRVEGYVDRMERWLAAADAVAGKPGGLATAEALAVGRPLVLTRPIPGAEDGNLRVVVGEGAALNGSTPERARAAFRALFAGDAVRERLAGAARRIGRPAAAAEILDALSLPATAARPRPLAVASPLEHATAG